MTIQEKLESIMYKDIIIYCDEYDKADIIMKKMNKLSSIKYSATNYAFGEPITAYTVVWKLEGLEKYIKQNYTIIYYDDFVKGTELEIKDETIKPYELSFSNIKKLLDDKYGEDNWVIK